MLWMGMRFLFIPQEKDFETHQSYQYQDLTTQERLSFVVCVLNLLIEPFASAAFHLGLLVNLDKLEAYLETATFFKEFRRNYNF